MMNDLKKSGWTPAKANDTAKRNLLDALQGTSDVGYRGLLAGLLGSPVDTANLVQNAGREAYNLFADKPVPLSNNPVGGAEWFGGKMQDAGLVSNKRRPLMEALAGFASPDAMDALKLAAVIPALKGADNLNASLLQKYLTTGKLDADEMAQYENNAIKMRDEGNQWFNVDNAKAQYPADTSRDEMARAIGFDADGLHGTTSVFSEFGDSYFKPHFFSPTDSPLANQFAQVNSRIGSPNVIPAKLRTGKSFDFRNKDHLDDLEQGLKSIGADFISDGMGGKVNLLDGVRSGEFNMVENMYAIDRLRKQGYDSFNIREVPEQVAFADASRALSQPYPDTPDGKDAAMAIYNAEKDRYAQYGNGLSRLHPSVKKVDGSYVIDYQGDEFPNNVTDTWKAARMMNTAIFDPKNIRSKFAAFDPLRKNSTDLLASLFLPAMVGGAVVKNERNKRNEKK